jgi:hypothetical protein
MTRRFVSLVVMICGLSATMWAQAALPIAIDQRVRVWTASPSAVTGQVVSINAGGFEVAEEGRTPVMIARATVQRIEVSRGRQSKIKKYAIRGAIISGLIGAILLPLQHEEVGEDGASVGEAIALGAWSGGLFGGLIGAAIGATKSTDRWEQVWP